MATGDEAMSPACAQPMRFLHWLAFAPLTLRSMRTPFCPLRPMVAALRQLYVYQVLAQDADGDPLSYSLGPNPPAGMTIDPSSGALKWPVPATAPLGSQAVEVQVSDGVRSPVLQDFTVTVSAQAVNHPPHFTSAPPLGATVGQLYSYNASASDADNDSLAWSLLVAPRGMVVDPWRGSVRWIPAGDQLGSWTRSTAGDTRTGRHAPGQRRFVPGSCRGRLAAHRPGGRGKSGSQVIGWRGSRGSSTWPKSARAWTVR